jgi:hypothetical protein
MSFEKLQNLEPKNTYAQFVVDSRMWLVVNLKTQKPSKFHARVRSRLGYHNMNHEVYKIVLCPESWILRPNHVLRCETMKGCHVCHLNQKVLQILKTIKQILDVLLKHKP